MFRSVLPFVELICCMHTLTNFNSSHSMCGVSLSNDIVHSAHPHPHPHTHNEELGLTRYFNTKEIFFTKILRTLSQLLSWESTKENEWICMKFLEVEEEWNKQKTYFGIEEDEEKRRKYGKFDRVALCLCGEENSKLFCKFEENQTQSHNINVINNKWMNDFVLSFSSVQVDCVRAFHWCSSESWFMRRWKAAAMVRSNKDASDLR